MSKRVYDSEANGLVGVESENHSGEIVAYDDVFRLTPLERSILGQSELVKSRKEGYKASITDSLSAVLNATYKGTEEGLELSIYDKLVVSVVGRTIEKGTVRDLKELANLLGETKQVNVQTVTYDVLVNEGKIKEEY